MANKIITISQASQSLSGDYLYLDLNMKSGPIKLDQEVYSDYERILRAELQGDEISDIVATFSDDSQRLILIYAKETDGNLYDAIEMFKQKAKFLILAAKDVDAVRNSIKNIFSWIPGERILNPEFGTNLRKYLYNGITDFNIEAIMAEIRYTIQQWEPRVTVERIVNANNIDDAEDNVAHIQIIYSIPSLTQEKFVQNLTYSMT